MDPAPYCDTCFPAFKALGSCPRSYIFDQEEFLPKVLEIIWTTASLSIFVILAALISYTIFARSSRVLFLLTSLVLQQTINEAILKNIFAEDRPPGACSRTYGLPSGHSSFAASWALLLTLEWFLYHDKVPFKTGRFYEPLRIVGILVMPFVPISRYFLNYHTPKQIYCGLLTGFAITSLYFYGIMTLMHKDNGKLWGSKIAQQFKRLNVEENIVLYKRSQTDEFMSNQGDLEQQPLNQGQAEDNSPTAGKETLIILPLKGSVRDYLWKKYRE